MNIHHRMHIEKNLQNVFAYGTVHYSTLQYTTVQYYTIDKIILYEQHIHNEVLSLFMFGFECTVLYANVHCITVHYITL